MSSARNPLPPGPWVLAAAAGLLVFAARIATLRFGACQAPFLDQWHIEADQILAPWLEGRLSWTAFFAPHHEHFPFWTRLLALGEAVLLRCWDPIVQGSVNAALWGAFIGAVVSWLGRNLCKLLALLGTLLIVMLYSLPHSWENSIWGLQSSVPLCLLFSFWHIRGTFEHIPGTRWWWLAQLSGVAALGAFGSAWAAPVAITFLYLWINPRDWRRWLGSAFIALAGVALLILALHLQPHEGALSLHAPNFTRFIGSWIIQAGWPSTHAFAAGVLYFPCFLLLLSLRKRADTHPFDLTLLALSIFTLGQGAALGLGRSGMYVGFVSRYADFLALGVLINALVLWRLSATRVAPRWMVALLAFAWLGIVGEGLVEINRTGHTLYFRENAEAWRWHREVTLRQYLATRDPHTLSTENARAYFYPEPTTLVRILDVPGFVDLLPVALRGNATPTPGDAAGFAARYLGENIVFFAWAGGVLLLFSLALPSDRHIEGITIRRDPWRAPLAFLIACASCGAMWLWPTPFVINAETRQIHLVTTDSPVPDFSFRIVTTSPYPPDNLEGGAAIWPEHFRNLFFGTHIDGPAFTGRAESTRFTLTSAFLVVPFAGYPQASGSALTLEVLDRTDHVIAMRHYDGANPEVVGFWGIDVKAFIGKSARLVIQDGQSTGRESWIAVAPPLQTPEDSSHALTERWEAERTAKAHVSLGVLSIGALVITGASLASGRRPAIA